MLLKRGSRGWQVERLQQGLAALGYHPGSVDGFFGQKTADALDDFQEAHDLYPDGVFGPGTRKVYDEVVTAKGFPALALLTVEEQKPDPTDPKKKLTWVECPADKWGDGYAKTTLRSDAAKAYKRLYAEVKARGGILTSAGGRRPLTVTANATQSRTSFHYTGRAFDMAVYSAMQDPTKDPFIVERQDRLWRVWCKVIDETAPMADLIQPVNLDAVVVVNRKNAAGKTYTQIEYRPWSGKAFDLTELAFDLGFDRIPGKRSFFNGGSFLGAEWWHFQWETGLVVGQSTFGEDLLKVYTLAECQKLAGWESAKSAVFGTDWA